MTRIYVCGVYFYFPKRPRTTPNESAVCAAEKKNNRQPFAINNTTGFNFQLKLGRKHVCSVRVYCVV